MRGSGARVREVETMKARSGARAREGSRRCRDRAREGSTDSTGGGLTLGVDGASGRRGGDRARACARGGVGVGCADRVCACVRARECVPFWHNHEGLAPL